MECSIIMANRNSISPEGRAPNGYIGMSLRPLQPSWFTSFVEASLTRRLELENLGAYPSVPSGSGGTINIQVNVD